MDGHILFPQGNLNSLMFIQVYAGSTGAPRIPYLFFESDRGSKAKHSNALKLGLGELGISFEVDLSLLGKDVPAKSGAGYEVVGAGSGLIRENGLTIRTGVKGSDIYGVSPNEEHFRELMRVVPGLRVSIADKVL